jgi:glycosyltransferase involved in cell wall biosynthesis
MENISENDFIQGANPLVTIIIPVYNREKYVADALNSLLNDDYQPKEIVVVDDGSTDKTAEILSKYEGINYHYQEHQGVSVARNTGLNLSHGRYITFLDSDDIWMPGRLEYSVNFFQSHPEVDYLLGKQETFLEDGFLKPIHIKQSWLDFPQESSGTGVLMTKKTCFDKVGFFNTDFRSSEDKEWLLRASEAKLQMARIPLIMVKQRLHGQNISLQENENQMGRVFRIIHDSIKRKQNLQ